MGFLFSILQLQIAMADFFSLDREKPIRFIFDFFNTLIKLVISNYFSIAKQRRPSSRSYAFYFHSNLRCMALFRTTVKVFISVECISFNLASLERIPLHLSNIHFCFFVCENYVLILNTFCFTLSICFYRRVKLLNHIYTALQSSRLKNVKGTLLVVEFFELMRPGDSLLDRVETACLKQR